ncbi:MAG: ribonuclease E/G [Parvibaculales bacterium]
MTNNMLIDASHPEETRVVVLRENQVEEFDFESENKRPLRGNIYLAQITRVEPSLQAAFVEYGGNRQGFLAFSEIHPDYYQIPVSDREELLREHNQEEQASHELEDPKETDGASSGTEGDNDAVDHGSVDDIGGDAHEEASTSGRIRKLSRKYKIQEVIKRRQVILIQVVKEERGNKGAALTTYLSLAGRYCVLMPNTARGGGISRKINNSTDRKKLKKIVEKLDVSDGMGLIIRTAGAQRTSTDIKRDYQYLTRMWESIRERTMESSAPSLVYEEGDLIKRSIRDLYNKDFEEILIQGEEGYKEAKDYMKMLMPSHARKVKQYKGETPIFHNNNIETQLSSMFSPVAHLPSGGYLVINQTEALVAIDVNSGRATKEHSIESTALKTNIEAAREVARQARLRDLAGLLVIDFIDMDENRNNRAVERKLKEALKDDRARIQVGKISPFGLLEMSRQRMRSGVLEGSSVSCDHCGGTGMVRSVESRALHVLRIIEDEAIKHDNGEQVIVRVPAEVASYILNQKRANLAAIESNFDIRVIIETDHDLNAMQMIVDRTHLGGQAALIRMDGELDGTQEDGGRDKKRRRRRRKGKSSEPSGQEHSAATEDDSDDDTDAEADESQGASASGDGQEDDDKPRRRRRGRRGGRRRRRDRQDAPEDGVSANNDGTDTPDINAGEGDAPPLDLSEIEAEDQAGNDEPLMDQGDTPLDTKPEKPKRRRRKPKQADGAIEGNEAETAEAETDDSPEDSEKPAKTKRKSRSKKTKAEEDKAEEVDAGVETETVQAGQPAPEETAAEASSSEATEDAPKRSGWWSR